MENMNSDEYSSVKDYFEELIINSMLFDMNVPRMTESERIQFYKYVVHQFEIEPKDVRDPLWGVVIQLESYPEVDAYKKNGDVSSENELTDIERQQIDETVKLLEARKRRNPIKKLILYLKGN